MVEKATIEWICAQHGDRVERVFGALNLEYPGLGEVGRLWEAGDRVEACRALLGYYRDRAEQSGRLLPAVAHEAEMVPEAEEILNDTFTCQNVAGTVPRQANGSLDWTHCGPYDDVEWGFLLNRHGHLVTLLSAYQRTGKRAYADRIDAHLREWILVNPYPGAHTDDPRWRGLETKGRIYNWARLFYALAADAALQPGTRVLMLSSMPDHAHYTRHFHADHGNWLAMQMAALVNVAVQWPEYAEVNSWVEYATETLSPELTKQVYPDGAQKELASHYHNVTRGSFQTYTDLLAQTGREAPAAWRDTVERMWNYTAYSMRPDGHGVLNNDSNLDYNRPGVERAADDFDRPDWACIASNGARGQAPAGAPSTMFPWAGQLVMRSGWGADAHWAVFDVGPWGTGHQHNDKLHLSVSAGGRDILVDAGRLYYKPDRWRSFVTGTAAHNTLLIDGQGQRDDRREATQPLDADVYRIAPDLDYARGTFDAGYVDVPGRATHTRAVVYVRGRFWVVVDRVETDRPRQVQALWHFHPDCAVEVQDGSVASIDAGQGNARVTPVGDQRWEVDVVKGLEEPAIQGWYSREYNVKQASPCAIFTAAVADTATFAWVIVPGVGNVAPPHIGEFVATDEGATVGVVLDGRTVQVQVPLTGGEPSVQE